MKRNGHANLALTLSFEFQKYLIRHPKFAERVPNRALVVFELEGRPAFNRWAKEVAAKQLRPKQKMVVIRVRGLRPPVSRLQAVQLVA
jgi:hypothetical protein